MTAACRQRMWRDARHLVGFLAAVVVMAGLVRFVPEPVADSLIAIEMRAAAHLWEHRVLGRLTAEADTFTQGGVTPADRAYLGSLVRGTDIHRISLVDAAGRKFWSSNPRLIGTPHRPDEFGSDVGRGETFYRAYDVTADQVADFDLPPDAAAAGGLRRVAQIELPVSAEGRVVGAIVLHRDVTEVRAAFVERVRLALSVAAAAMLTTLAAVSLLLLRANRREGRAGALREAEGRALLAEQVRLAREVRLLGELNEWLQSSRSLPELFDMVSRFMAHVMPGVAGSLYVFSNSRDVLDGAASWNGARHDAHIRPEDCWGLRRGRTYAHGRSEVDFPCAHAHEGADRRTLCMPILAHGETVGLMTLTARPETSDEGFDAHRAMAQTCAEQISLAVANVRMRDALHHQAVRDPLTGLYNRRHLLDVLRRLVDARGPFALVSLDVDGFKRFNDAHGHDAGDVVLRAVGEAVGRHADGDEVACRMGGEELMLLLPGASAVDALQRAEAVRLDVAALAIRYGDKTLPRVTVSAGVAHSPTHGTMPQQVIRAADDALYAAKAQGRNRVVLAGGDAAREADDAEPLRLLA